MNKHFKKDKVMLTINPYLNYDGTCEEAFNLYKSVFGGKFSRVERYKNMPPPHPIPDPIKEKIMHISLSINKEITLMGSDVCEGFGPPLKPGNSFSLCINVDSKEEAERVFNGLAKGGNITMALDTTFWGAYFGAFDDKYGIQWMISYDKRQNS
jgi:PhnB protein